MPVIPMLLAALLAALLHAAPARADDCGLTIEVTNTDAVISVRRPKRAAAHSGRVTLAVRQVSGGNVSQSRQSTAFGPRSAVLLVSRITLANKKFEISATVEIEYAAPVGPVRLTCQRRFIEPGPRMRI